MTPGTVYLVGAGPGDPELITLKAHRVLGQADAVVYDHLVDAQLLELVRPGCERIFAGKKPGAICRPLTEIDETLVRLAFEDLNNQLSAAYAKRSRAAIHSIE